MFWFVALLFKVSPAETNDHERIEWHTKQLSAEFFSEGATVGDFNQDGQIDVASGPWWYEGPDWEKRHQFYPQDAFDPHGYSNNFFSFTEDFNQDGWDDILVYGFPGQDASWFENPKGVERFWPRHKVMDSVDNESPTFIDVTGDGQREVVCSVGGYFGYAKVNRDDPALPWEFVRISDQSAGGRFTHGLGVGDVNGDGRMDILERRGWWEQPENKTDLPWRFHPVQLADSGSAQIFAYDVDGDGDNDLVCSLNAHGFGLVWHENLGADSFKRHLIMGTKASENEYGVVFSQLHAVQLVDIDGDGLRDIVTGKRHWAHGPAGDSQPQHPAVLYWFQLKRDPENQTVRWIPHMIDDDSGIGVEVDVADVNGDNWPDVIVGNKKGTHVHLQQRWRASEIDHAREHKIGEQQIARPTIAGQPNAAGLEPLDAAAAMTVPDGFRVKLAAGEPMVHQPIAMTFDHRGRLWIAEAYEYPVRASEGEGKDKIIILEDTDQDGTFDQRKIFADNLNLISGLEVGFGGVWVGAAPYFMFIPDRDGDDRPDSDPQILLDGFDYRDTHETLNAFNWGPDGWLYGCHGVFNYSNVGKPGCDDADRLPLTCAVWRYHPTRHEFEAFARGTSNPWGVDFNDYGHAFLTACVIPHMYHMIQGGRYQRQGGQHVNPHTYDDIKTIADHAHYTGKVSDHAWWGRNHNTDNQSTYDAGGGHAHCGAMIYLGNNWPRQYRNSIFMTNLLGNRINNDILQRVGSGYVASHGHDFLFANDQWFRCINQRLAPDGSVYLIDWYDQQACHRGNKELWDRTNGRIYQVAYGQPETSAVDLSSLADAELAGLQLHENEWQVRVSRRLLQERAAAGTLDPQVVRGVLQPILRQDASVTRKLRAAWTLHACDLLRASDREAFLNARGHKSEYLRSWAIQLDAEDGNVDDLDRLASLAASDDSPLVRLYLASALQRLPLDDRWAIAEQLVRHGDDASDHNLPMLIWYGIEPLVTHDVGRAIGVAAGSRIPIIQNYIYRRAAADSQTIAPLLVSLKDTDDTERQKQIIGEVTNALARQGNLEMPKQWPEVSAKLMNSSDASVRDQILAISVKFGDITIFPTLRDIANDRQAATGSRKNALTALVSGKDPQLVPLLVDLFADEAMKSQAIRAMAGYTDPSIPATLLKNYRSLSSEDQSFAVATLASRVEFADQLLDAVDKGEIQREKLTAFTVRQLLLFKNEALNKKIENVWGQISQSSEDKEQRILELKQRLSPAVLAKANLSDGRAIYEETCAKCHQLFGSGGRIGPDITGSNRANLDYILHNMIDPNALIGKDYQTTQLLTTDGRVITGLIKDETDSAITLQTTTEQLVINKNDIEQRSLSKASMMPEGQLDKMKPRQIRDLIAYLASPNQVPLPGSGPTYDESERMVHGAIEGESLSITTVTGGNAAPQDMKGFQAGKWSRDRHLWWVQAKPGHQLTLQFAAPSNGEYEVYLAMTKANDYGVFTIKLNGRTLAENVDLYDPQVISTGPLNLGKHRLTSNENQLQIEVTGANPNAKKSYMFGLDYVYLQAPPPTESERP